MHVECNYQSVRNFASDQYSASSNNHTALSRMPLGSLSYIDFIPTKNSDFVPQLGQRSNHIFYKIAIGETLFDQVEERSILHQRLPVPFHYRDQQLAQSTVRAERAGVDGPDGFQKVRRCDHGPVVVVVVVVAVQACLERGGGELFEEGNVVFVGQGVDARVVV